MSSAPIVHAGVPTVLVVDDDPNLSDLLCRFLTRQGIKVLVASSGPQCLETVQNSPSIDAIVLDVMMPGMDGLQVSAALKQMEQTRGIPIILLTARGDEKTRAAGVNLGVSAFMTKPTSGRDLLAQIHAHITPSHEARRRQQALPPLAEPESTIKS
ncbi:MAG: response regulator [Deltaproteobacteria bacterium]|nr:response regulator [Deltaproteobacteria bacterium]